MRNITLSLGLLTVLAVILVACTLGGEPAPETVTAQTPDPTEADLASTRWRLVSIEHSGAETPALESAEPSLEFEGGGQAGGSGGCNTFGAQYEVQGDMLSFRQLTSTLIACDEEGVGDQERRYFQALESAGRYEQAGNRLTIWYDDGQGVLDFVAAGSSMPGTQEPVSDLLCSHPDEVTGPDWNVCRSRAYGFEVEYPPEGELIDHSETTARIDLPFAPGTNLTEKYLDISVVENTPTCSSSLTDGYPSGAIPAETVPLDDLEFVKESGQDAAAGSVYNWQAYSISRESRCVSLSFVLRSHHPELEPTPPPEYDMEAESEVFEEIAATFAWLAPPQTPTLTGAPTGTASPPPAQPTPTPERIRFETGATSGTVTGALGPAESDRYVLYALGGQRMTVELEFASGQAVLAIWGEDGAVLLSERAEAARFEGVLPATQDYYLQLKGGPDGETDYSMTVTIPPLN